jgi:hypothetical protein
MSDDLVKRLRERIFNGQGRDDWPAEEMGEAADKIERLRAELARLQHLALDQQQTITELGQDKERLDWIDEQPPPVIIKIARCFRDDDIREDANIRAAIDAAREKK